MNDKAYDKARMDELAADNIRLRRELRIARREASEAQDAAATLLDEYAGLTTKYVVLKMRIEEVLYGEPVESLDIRESAEVDDPGSSDEVFDEQACPGTGVQGTGDSARIVHWGCCLSATD